MCVPTVYSKDKWALRRLSDIEVADVLDLPGTLRKKMSVRQLAQLSQVKIPGKVIAAVIDSVVMLVARRDSRTLDETDSCAEPARSLKRAMDAEVQVANKRTHVEKAVSSGQWRTEENSCRSEAIVESSENGSRLLTVGD